MGQFLCCDVNLIARQFAQVKCSSQMLSDVDPCPFFVPFETQRHSFENMRRAVRRVPSTLVSSVSNQQQQRASFASATSVLLQQQHTEETLQRTHGFGMINHGAVVSKDSKTVAAADLMHTSVAHGLGTSAADPYTRTLPNLEMRPPETTVISRDGSSVRPTLDEIAMLGGRREALRFWLGGDHPRLPLWVNSLKSTNPLPVSSKMATILEEFERIAVPAACAERGEDPVIPTKRWQSIVRRFLAIPRATLLSRAAFDGQLELATKDGLSLFGNDAPMDELQTAVDLLRRQAVHQRNAALDSLSRVVANTELVADGDAIWATLFALVRQHRSTSDLFSGTKESSSSSSLEFIWDSIIEGPNVDHASPALVSAPVALYLVALTAAHTVLSTETTERVHGRMDAPSKANTDDSSRLVSSIDKRTFVRNVLQGLDASSLLAEKSEQALRSLGAKKELVDSITNALAAETVFASAIDVKSASVAKLFRDPAQGGLLLYRATTSTNDASIKSLIQKTLSTNGFSHSDEVRTNPSRWASKYEAIASTLLKNATFVALAFEAVRAETGAAQQQRGGSASAGIVSEDGLKELNAFKELREQYERRRTHRVGVLVDYLSSFEGVEVGVRYCAALGCDMSALVDLQRAASEATDSQRTSVSSIASLSEGTFPQQLVSAIADAHPSWVRANVLEKLVLNQPVDLLSSIALRTAIRMLVRVSYVPHAGAAMIARNTRRRIGPIGTAPHEQNIALEVGMTEKMDNLLHKRYDWQGWYQRMQDVHNRNVSLRFNLQDLRTLDSEGKPFFDMQSERRLRIVAKERVGMGILKLDSDKYEDKSDNYTFGSVKVSQLVADAKKTMLGPEYVPTVEVKVRRPSGQTKLQYSALDYDRVEKKSAQLYKKYVELKKKSFFVPPTDVWLDVTGLQARKLSDAADEQGYTVDLFDSMGQQDK